MKPSSGTVHHVTAADRGQTLAAFLRAKLASGNSSTAASWSQVQKLVRSRHVLVHGNICTDFARRLKIGEVVKVLPVAAAAPPKADDVRIVYVDDQVAVVEKPTGITTTRHTEELSWPTRRRQIQPTLVECRLETGRTHQIRIHLAEIGHTVCGERVYSAPRALQVEDSSGALRVMLHAAELGFVHPESGEDLKFSSPLPADMRKVLDRLRSLRGQTTRG